MSDLERALEEEISNLKFILDERKKEAESDAKRIAELEAELANRAAWDAGLAAELHAAEAEVERLQAYRRLDSLLPRLRREIQRVRWIDDDDRDIFNFLDWGKHLEKLLDEAERGGRDGSLSPGKPETAEAEVERLKTDLIWWALHASSVHRCDHNIEGGGRESESLSARKATRKTGHYHVEFDPNCSACRFAADPAAPSLSARKATRKTDDAPTAPCPNCGAELTWFKHAWARKERASSD